MAENRTIDVSQLIDEGNLNALIITLIIIGFSVILLDGYDIVALGYAAPALIEAWKITNKTALGPAFSASLFGMLAGAPLFGYVGDRFGRKAAIIGGCLTLGLFTLSVTLAASLSILLVLRFFAGFGIGGLIPSLIAVTTEYAPRRFRATMVTVMYSGITFGAAVPGAISAWLVPHYGWQVLFLVGGVLPLLIAGAVALWMPESIKYLIVSGKGQSKIHALVARLKPGLSIGPGTSFIVHKEAKYRGFSPKHLFSGELATITPLLWICLATGLMGYYLLASWLPTLLTTANVSSARAAIATAIFQIGGMIGQLTLGRQIDKRGLSSIAVMFGLAIPIVASIGYVIGLRVVLLIVILLSGFCVLGIQAGLNVAAAMMYPTAFRANGSGWAIAIGRFGAIIGPMAGGVLMDMGFGFKHVFVIAALPFVAGLIASIFLAPLGSARLRAEQRAYSAVLSRVTQVDEAL